MKEFNLELLNGLKANFYYELGQEEVIGDHTHFKLGDLELSLVARDCSRSWDFASVGIIFESRDYYQEDAMDTLKYSEPILVLITQQWNLPKGEEGKCLLAFLDPDTKELLAYISIVYPEWLDQAYCRFKVLRTAVSRNLQERLLR
jgi:hypothetical protein